jgi:hypothetical protein
MKKYVTLTTVSQFRLKYVVPIEKLQELNPSHELTDAEAVVWAEESVMTEELEEVGQSWIGEYVVEASITDENGAAAAFVRENPNLVKEDKMDSRAILDRIENVLTKREPKKDIAL